MGIDDLRVKIRQFNMGLVSGLKTRSRYSHNLGLYEPLTPPARIFYGLEKLYGDGVDLLSATIAAYEDMHQRNFGRYDFNDQSRFNSAEIREFYLKTVLAICHEGDDDDKAGEIMTTDAENMLLLNERISNGKFVAMDKYRRDEDLRTIVHMQGISYPVLRESVMTLITKPKVEQEILDDMIKYTRAFEMPELAVERFCKGIIEMTKNVQLEYLLGLRKPNFDMNNN